MCAPAMPKSVAAFIFKDVFIFENFSLGNCLELARQGNWIVDRPERVCHHLEFSLCELCRNVVCKAGSEKRQTAAVIDFEICGRDVYFRVKVHAVNLNRIRFACG